MDRGSSDLELGSGLSVAVSKSHPFSDTETHLHSRGESLGPASPEGLYCSSKMQHKPLFRVWGHFTGDKESPTGGPWAETWK